MGRHTVALAALAAFPCATPQNFDFAAIAAAPSVANGPDLTVVAVAAQTASLYTSFAVTDAAVPSATATLLARDLEGRGASTSTVNQDTTVSSYNAGLGATGQLTTVLSGITYWLNGGSTHNFLGSINNFGRIVVSQTSYLKTNFAGGQTSRWSGHDANNGNLMNGPGALIQLNDIGSASAPTYSWDIRSMSNNGTIQWCGRGDTGGCTFLLYSDLDAVNNGLVSFEQAFDNYGAAFSWRNPTLTTSSSGANIYNNGAFRLINTVHHNVQNVYGNGCWQIGKGGVLYLEDGTGVYQNPSKGPSFPGQSIMFQDSSAVLHMDTQVYARYSNFGAQVFGFGAGNAIEFYEYIWSFSYTSSTGLLKVTMLSGNTANIKLGSGYDSTQFYRSRNSQKYNWFGYNAIYYRGSAPAQSAPSQCTVSTPACSNLGGGLPPVSSAFTSTSSGSTATTKPSFSMSTSSSVSTSTGSVLSSTSIFAYTTSSISSSTTTLATTTSTTVSSVASTLTTSTLLPSTSSTSTTSASGSSTSSTAAYLSSLTSTSSTSSTTVSQSSIVLTTPLVCTNKPYTPYYPALATSYTTDPALTATTTSGQACPTSPEAGTYCGFINPEDPCAAQPDGYGPVPTPDTDSAFLAFPSLHSLAQSAPTQVPSADGSVYTQVFKDLNASSSAQSYLGLHILDSYNVAECASLCDCSDLCTAFNIHAERDPSLNPAANDSTAPTVWGYWCPNPASMTTFRCTLWGSNLDASTATNEGAWREQFHVVITASNGYDKTNVTTPLDPSGPSGTSSRVIATSTSTSAADSSSQTTFSTVTKSSSSTGSLSTSLASTSTFSSTTGNSTRTSATSASLSSSTVQSTTLSQSSTSSSSTISSLSATSSVPSSSSTSPSSRPSNPGHPWQKPQNCHGKAIDAPNNWLGSRFFPGPFNPQVCSGYAFAQNDENAQKGVAPSCKMFNAFYVNKNGKPHGTYCSLYNQALDTTWATNSGGYSGGDQFDCKQSWTYALV